MDSQKQAMPLEQMMEHIHLSIQQAFSIDPYLDGVAVVFNWKIGNTDLPFGLMLGREGHISTPTSLVGISQQTSKMLMHQADQISQMFDSADKAAAELAQKIKTLKGEMDGDSESREKA
jgi:hypothetical protein